MPLFRSKKRKRLMPKSCMYRVFQFFALFGLLVGLSIVVFDFVMYPYEAKRNRDKVEHDLTMLKDSILQFNEDHERFPETVQDLVAQGYIETVPTDPFADGAPYEYRNLVDGTIVEIHSQSPYGKGSVNIHPPRDAEEYDKAHEDYYYYYQLEHIQDATNNGMVEISRAMIEFEWDMENDLLVDKIELIKDHGWNDVVEWLELYRADPAVAKNDPDFHYLVSDLEPHQQAKEPAVPDQAFDPLVATLLVMEGMSQSEAEAEATRRYKEQKREEKKRPAYPRVPSLDDVMELFEANETAFALMSESATKPHLDMVEAPLFTYSISSDIWSFHKLLLAKGQMHEAKGESHEAIDYYLLSMHFGESLDPRLGYSVVNFRFLFHRGASLMIRRVLLDRSLGAQDLNRIVEYFRDVSQLDSQFRTIYLAEEEEKHHFFAVMINRNEQRVMDGNLPERLGWNSIGRLHGVVVERKEYEQAVQVCQMVIEDASLPYPEFRQIQYPQPDEYLIPEPHKTRASGIHSDTYNAATLLIAALQLHHLRHGRYPESLDELAPILDTVPDDPFTTEPFLYSTDGDTFTLRSLGPDLEDQGGAVVYDPTNGTRSDGDLVFGHGW